MERKGPNEFFKKWFKNRIVPFPSPRGLKEALGSTVFVESIKFRDAQKMPDSTLVSSFQFKSTL